MNNLIHQVSGAYVVVEIARFIVTSFGIKLLDLPFNKLCQKKNSFYYIKED
ncbi:hypothetical protein HQN90_30750 [Paenibacillus alba]|nr:hypothetical protein [Paenibacillus alba]